MIEIDVLGRELVVTFVSDGQTVDKFICTDGHAALRIALIILSLHGELHAGDVLSVEQRRRPNLIEAGLG
jgi:hypothetical protein